MIDDLARQILAFLQSNARIANAEIARRVEKAPSAIPKVQEVHHVAGEDCFLVKVRAPDTESLGRLLRSRFGDIPGVDSTRTTIVLETTKETGTVPVIPGGPTEDAERATDRPEGAPA